MAETKSNSTEVKELDPIFAETLKRLSSLKIKERSGILYPTINEHEKITGNEVAVGYQLTLSENDYSKVITWMLEDFVEEIDKRGMSESSGLLSRKDENVIVVDNATFSQIIKIMRQ